MFENFIRFMLIKLTNFLPVKVIRDDRGVPFLYRYHLFALTNDGPGMCIHRFVNSDPDRGYHDHPWKHAISFILAGSYEERIYTGLIGTNNNEYKVKNRHKWSFNYLNGNDFHRVMVPENSDVWTLFAFGKRSKCWGMINFKGEYSPMSEQISDADGGWWNFVKKGLYLHLRKPLDGNIVATVDIIVRDGDNILLIKRSKDPFINCWALPGGRVESTDKDLEQAAKRELFEETNLNSDLKHFKTIGNNTRDPRGFSITSVFWTILKPEQTVKAGDDAIDFQWFYLNSLPDNIAFDHKEIIKKFRDSQIITSDSAIITQEQLLYCF